MTRPTFHPDSVPPFRSRDAYRSGPDQPFSEFPWERTRATRLLPDKCWLGGPVAFVVRREHAAGIADMLSAPIPKRVAQLSWETTYGSNINAADVRMYQFHQESNWSFVATHPPLCVENERGGSYLHAADGPCPPDRPCR